MAITNYTGAALEQQSAILDARRAQSSMLSTDLMGKRLPAGLAPAEAVFGTSDGASIGPEALGLDGGVAPNLGALQQNFLLP